jgi:SEL1 protein
MYRVDGDAKAAVAAHHYFHAARDASVAYHERGKQPLHEMDRLYDFVDSEGREDLSARGQRGEDDELIQYQQVRADQHGDVEAMAAMGDLYYWGARGIPRDHERAFHYFERAAQAGNADAQCAVANMLLRGEGGVEQDNTTAIAWYERAAEAQNHPRALNGLGFIHFHGSAGVSENKTRALELFERAANEQRDGDSLFNTGYCFANGIGTTDGRTNMTRAIELFETASHKFGHFDSVMQLAEIWMRGVATREETVDCVDPDWSRALPYVKAAADTGRWGGKMRAGFSLFLARDWQRAVVQYHDAEAFGGYPLATSNLAFLYDALLIHDVKNDGVKQQKERRALEYLFRAHEQNGDREVLVRIGDFHFQGLAGLSIDLREALTWYSRSSARGDDRGAYNVGYMYENGIGGVDANLLRARRYYERAAELAADSNRGYFASIPARLALLRVAARELVRGSSMLEAIVNRLGSNREINGFGTDAAGGQDDRRYSVTGLVSALGSTAVVGAVLAVLARRQLQFLRPN